jgi:chromosomal replication initiation ATPase DnaA
MMDQSISAIQEHVGRRRGVTLAQMVSPGGDRKVIDARHEAMWLARAADYSYPQIGRAFGRHHTAVIYALRSLERKITNDPSCGAQLVRLSADAA